MSSAGFQDLPDLSRDALVDLAGWTVLKEARALAEADAVSNPEWNPPVVSAVVKVASVTFFPRLNLRSLTFAENKCNCRTGRQGLVCAHAIAACIALENRKNSLEKVAITGAAKAESETSAELLPEPRSIKLSPSGEPLYAAFLLPPNLDKVAPRNAIMVKLELRHGGQRKAPESLFKGQNYRVELAYGRALARIEQWNDGRLAGLLQLRREQLRQLISDLKAEPAFYWVNEPLKPIQWSEDSLNGVSTFLEEPELLPKTEQARPSIRRSIGVPVVSPHTPRVPSIERNPMQMEVDGSPHFLAIKAPSRESPVYARALSILNDAGFKLEPSNGRWWVRDRHKVLNFLAERGDELNKIFDPIYTDNYTQKMRAVHRATIRAEGRAEGVGFVLDVSVQAGGVSEEVIRRALAAGQYYVIQGDSIWLLPPAQMERLAEAQRAITGVPGQALVPNMRRRLGGAELRDVESILEPIVEELVTPEDWRERSQALKSVGNLKPAPIPASLDQMLRTYQRIGVAWTWHLYRSGLGGVLADEMGLGKTIQALSLIAAVRGTAGAGTALVVCPASLVENWRREAARFTPWLKVFRHHQESRLQSAEEVQSWDLIITSYGTLVRDQEIFDQSNLGVVIADEAQHIKNRRTQAAAALRAVKASARFVLTGTPIENSVDDLRSLFAFILPGYLARLPAGLKGEDKAWFDQRHLTQAAPYILRRTKKLVAPELPEKITQTVFCDLTSKQMKLYNDLREKGQRALFDMEMKGAGEGKLRMEALTQLLRLRQTCADPRLLDGKLRPEDSAKLQAFEEILEEAIDGGHRMLVFSQFVSVLKLLGERLESSGLKYCYLDGQTANRQRVCDVFNKDESIPVFLISLKAGGTGLNLTGADTVVHFDPWWNPAVEAQATDRAHRIGQTRVVTSIKLIASGTVEEKVLELQSTKAELLQGLLDESAAESKKVSLSDLRSLLAS